jgi:hypothetical protein
MVTTKVTRPEPKREYYTEMKYCRDDHIPIERLRDRDTGREFMMILKRTGFYKGSFRNCRVKWNV